MLKYIHEGPQALERTLEANEDRIREVAELVRKGGIERIIVTGIGSSYTAPVMAQPLWVWHSPVPVQVVESSEFENLPARLVNQKTMVVAVSRSGERGAVSQAVEQAARAGACLVAVTGVAGSSITREARFVILTGEGPEITFPKTKSVMACAGVLMRLALALGEPDDAAAGRRLLELNGMPARLENTLEKVECKLCRLIPAIEDSELVVIAGSGGNYGVALEAALKLQEASHVPGYGNRISAFLNGPIGAVNAHWLVILLITPRDQEVSEKVLRISRSLGARSLAVIEPGITLGEKPDYCLSLPAQVDAFLAPLAYLVPMHLHAYYRTVARGLDPDAPASMNTILEAILPPGREEPELRKRR